MSDQRPNGGNDKGAPPKDVRVSPKPTNWLMWAVLAALALLLLLMLGLCHRRAAPVAAAPPVAAVASPPVAAPVEPEGTAGIGTYIAGTEATPRTFVFERLHFDTAKSAIRPDDLTEVQAAADALKASRTARVKIVGYADSTGSAPANATLGLDRANAVKSAMIARGVGADRIDTASGGETNPADTNATAAGRAENRRTELIVLRR